MKKLIAVSIALVIAGCASPPKAPLLSPYGREPINSDDAISEYRQQSEQEMSLLRERNDLRSKVDALQNQVSQLKAFIVLKAAEESSDSLSAKPTRAPKTAAPFKSSSTEAKSTKSEISAPNSAIEIREDAVVFRVFNGYAQTTFSPSAQIEKPLLDAAKESTRIDIRGRTDSNYANEANQRIALSRAIAARDYLVSQGVDAKKIRLYFSSTGMFIADNSTNDGRALNRRVEVEANGVNIDQFKQKHSS